MQKRKRSSTSNGASASSGEKVAKKSDPEEVIELVDLADSPELEEEPPTSSKSSEESARKKAKLDEAASKRPQHQHNGKGSSKSAPTPPVASDDEKMDTEDVYFTARSNGRSLNGNSSDEFKTPPTTTPPPPPVFKKPEPPQKPSASNHNDADVSSPSPGPSSAITVITDVHPEQDLARTVRTAFMESVEEMFQEMTKNKEYDIGTIKALLLNIHDCIIKWPYVFAVNIFPLERGYQDRSPENEIDEFIKWIIFGLISLLFTKAEIVKPVVGNIKRLFRSICQLVLNGHPGLLDKLVPQLLGILRELVSIYSHHTLKSRDVIIRLTGKVVPENEDSETLWAEREVVEHTFAIPISTDSEWAIPHFLETISILVPRIYYYHVKDRLMFVELVKRLLWKFSPESIRGVVSSYSFGVIPNQWFMTEDRIISTIRKILEYPGMPKLNTPEVRRLFSMYDMMRSDRSMYSGFLEESSLVLLKNHVSEYMFSDDCLQRLKNGGNDLSFSTLKRLLNREKGDCGMVTPEEAFVRAMCLVRLMSLDVVLHPVVESVLISKLKNVDTSANATSSYRPATVRDVSPLWDKILECWESKLDANNGQTKLEVLNFLDRSMLLVKLTVKVQEGLMEAGVHSKFKYFNDDHFNRWAMIVHDILDQFESLQLSRSEKYQLLSTIFETIQDIAKCSQLQLPRDLVKNLITIPASPWIERYRSFIPPDGQSMQTVVLKASTVLFITTSPSLIASSLKCLRTTLFSKWKHFILKTYSSLMASPAVFNHPESVVEILDAIAEVNWLMKEMGLKTVFAFLSNLMANELWIWNSHVRSALGRALTSLPCICCYFLGRSNIISQVTGCIKCSGRAMARRSSLPDLTEDHMKKIIQLTSPVLKSSFYSVKLEISNLITRCNNHAKDPTSSIAFPMVEMALLGKADLCQAVFGKIGALLVENDPSKLETVNKAQVDLAQKIFRIAIPTMAAKVENSNGTKRQLPQPFRAKVMLGALELSSAGPMSLPIFVEIARLMLFILAFSTIEESAVVIYCQTIIERFAQIHKCVPHEMFSRVRCEVAEEFVKIGINIICKDVPVAPGSANERVTEAIQVEFCNFLDLIKFGGKFNKAKVFQMYFYPEILQNTIHKLPYDQRYQILLKSLGRSYQVNSESEVDDAIKTSYMMQDFVMYYFPTLFLGHPSSVVEECFGYIKETCNFSMFKLIREQEQRLVDEALCRFDDRHDEVLQLLNLIPTWRGQDDSNSQTCFKLMKKQTLSQISRTDILELLDTRFLGFVIHFDFKMGSRIETIERKKMLIRSFAKVIKYMGKNKMSQFRSKVYKTLTSVTDVSPMLHRDLLEAWKEFSDSLDNFDLGTMTSQIIVAVLPLREDPILRKSVDGLISRLVIFKENVTKPYYKELYFLLEMENPCEQKEVERKINEARVTMKANNWLDYFNGLMSGASHENFYIRYQAFKTLRNLLAFENDEVQRHLLSKGDTIVSQMISTMLEALRSGGMTTKDQRQMQLTIIDCFGLMGALDPIKFQTGKGGRSSSQSKGGLLSCEVAKFSVIYLQELAKEFQEAKDTATFDYCACLIRIVLQVMNVKADKKDPIWQFLTNDQRDLIAPLLERDDYKMYNASNDKKPPTFTDEPIYLSEHGKTFDSWVTNWMTVLISFINYKEEEVRLIFKKSLMILRMNARLFNFIAPYVATYAIFCGDESQRQQIVREIMTVLERWSVLEDRKTSSNTQPVRDEQSEQGLEEEDDSDMSLESETIFHSRCTQVILAVLDHLLRLSDFAKKRWGMKKFHQANPRYGSASQISTPMSEESLEAIDFILDGIPKMLISQVAFDYESYTAALYYFERELKSVLYADPTSNFLQENIDYLQRIYVALNDMDSVIGVSAIREVEPVDHELVIESIGNTKTGKSIKILERMSAKDSDNPIIRNALMQAYVSMEQPYVADLLIKATLNYSPEWELSFQEVQSQTLLKLQRWDDLTTFTDKIENVGTDAFLKEKISTWGLAIPRVISRLYKNEFDKADEIISSLKLNILAPLIATCDDLYPYKRAYHHIVQLHAVSEIEDVIKLLRLGGNDVMQLHETLASDVRKLIDKWNARLINVSKSKRILTEILTVRMNCLEVLKKRFNNDAAVENSINDYIRDCWIEMAREASKVGNFILADNCLYKVQMETQRSIKVQIEEAKILSRKGKKAEAVTILEKALNEFSTEDLARWKQQRTPQSSDGTRTLCAKALLLQTKLREELKLMDNEEYIKKYKETTEIDRHSEKNFFAFGSYYDRQWSQAEKKDDQKWWKIQAMIVRCYSQSLLYGCKYVYQSLPRLLSIWFDFSAKSEAIGPAREELKSMQVAIKTLKERIPAYILMTAFSQLISRLCHGHDGTWQLLRDLIAYLMKAHPHQTLWMTIAVKKSINKVRKTRCGQIYDHATKLDPRLQPIINNYIALTDKLITLCDKKCEDSGKESLSKLCGTLSKTIASISKTQDKILVPFEAFMTPTLPEKASGSHSQQHSPFPATQVYISGIEDEITIMASLVHPKKLTLIGTNGKKYGLLVKPKDDLRKDSKVMEVNKVVNWYLSQDTDSSQRRLHVRTYAVTPLNETCGLLEWVENLQTTRALLINLYREKGLFRKHKENHGKIKLEMSVKRKLEVFDDILADTPPVLSEWFYSNFSDHQSWYTARMAYTRTAAVISMVGYIMGLGDRHGENILVDAVTGETVHVDFNCIFNKGETFMWPEKVPFRLTQNVIDGMGPLGVEGGFRKACEIVLKIFRERQTIFISVLRPFVFDPLVEWDKEDKRAQTKPANPVRSSIANLETGEITSQVAVETMKYIENRIEGTARTKMTEVDSELSVEAMVQFLIKVATSNENLCQMFPGWCPQY